MEESILAKWKEVKDLVEELEVDVVKNARGNSAAGVRARKGFRHIKTLLSEQVKLSLGVDKNKSAV